MRPFTLLPTLACLILIVAHRARGLSSGAPEESCDSLTVNHTHVGMPAPGAECGPPCLTALCFETCRQFRQLRLIGSSADNFTYNCNETYELQLATTDPKDESLNGYMVAPREDTGPTFDGNASYVGSWENGTDVKLLCNGQAVTQSMALNKTKTVTMTWKAPMYGLQKVAFWFVIVPSTAFYYLPVKSLTAIPSMDHCTCPPGHCAMTMNSTDTICVEPRNSLCSAGQVFNEEMCQCEACALMCQNGGTLNKSTCDCADGYSGDSCGRECISGSKLKTARHSTNVDTQPIPPVNVGVFGTEQFIGIVAGVAASIFMPFVILTIVIISTVAFCCCCLRRVKHSQK